MKIHELISESELNEVGLAGGLLGGGLGLLKTGAKALGVGAVKSAAKQGLTKGATYGSGMLKLLKVGNAVMNILTIFGIGKFVVEYYTKVEAAQKMVEKGEWTEAEFQDYRQGKMTKLVLEIASSTVLFSGLKVVTGWTKWVYLLKMVPLPAVKALGVFMNTVSEAGRVAFIGYLLSDHGTEARQAIANLIGRGIVDNTLGGNGVALVDTVKHLFGLSQKTGEWKNPLDQKVPGTNDKETDTTTGTSNKQSDDSSDYAYDKSKFTRNANGALVPKIEIDK
jgi:hypothetical protein